MRWRGRSLLRWCCCWLTRLQTKSARPTPTRTGVPRYISPLNRETQSFYNSCSGSVELHPHYNMIAMLVDICLRVQTVLTDCDTNSQILMYFFDVVVVILLLVRDVVFSLFQYGADVNRLDQENRSALWYAKQVGSKDCAAILSANGCPDSATLPRLRRGSLRTPLQPNDIKHKDRTSINSLHWITC